MSSLEARKSGQMIKTMRRAGIFAYKTADRFQSGVPDIYVQGGRWIENKILIWSDMGFLSSPVTFMTPKQKSWADRLTGHGDLVFVSAFYFGAVKSGNPRFMMAPWIVLREMELTERLTTRWYHEHFDEEDHHAHTLLPLLTEARALQERFPNFEELRDAFRSDFDTQKGHVRGKRWKLPGANFRGDAD